MAINCKLCNKELDAFSGGRCRQCRQLVCEDCLAEGKPGQNTGLLCKACAALKPEPQVVEETKPEPSGAKSRALPMWIWAAVCAVLLGVFVYIILMPYLNSDLAIKLVVAGDKDQYQEGLDILTQDGGGYALGKLEEIATKSREPARSRAMRAIGAVGSSDTPIILRKLRRSPQTPAYMQAVIDEAFMIYHRRHEKLPEGYELEKTQRFIE